MPRLETRLENKESKNVSLPRHGPHAMGSRATSLTCLFYPILSPPISHLSSQPAPPPISTLPSVSPPHFPCFSKSRVNDLSSQFGPWTEVFPLKKWRDSRSRAEMKNVLSRVFVLTKKKKKKKKITTFFAPTKFVRPSYFHVRYHLFIYFLLLIFMKNKLKMGVNIVWIFPSSNYVYSSPITLYFRLKKYWNKHKTHVFFFFNRIMSENRRKTWCFLRMI